MFLLVQLSQYYIKNIYKKKKYYTKYCGLYNQRSFSTQVGGLAIWIGHLGCRKLKLKTIREYLAGFQSLQLDCTLDIFEFEVYTHSIFQKIIIGF